MSYILPIFLLDFSQLNVFPSRGEQFIQVSKLQLPKDIFGQGFMAPRDNDQGEQSAQ